MPDQIEFLIVFPSTRRRSRTSNPITPSRWLLTPNKEKRKSVS